MFLRLDDQSFSHLRLSSYNFFHVYVGRVDSQLMVLPLLLHLHSSLSSASAPSVLGRVFARLPALIEEMNGGGGGGLKAGKESPMKAVETDEILLTYQFKSTHPMYRIMVHNTTQHETDDSPHPSSCSVSAYPPLTRVSMWVGVGVDGCESFVASSLPRIRRQ